MREIEEVKQAVAGEMTRLDRALARKEPGAVDADVAFTLGFLHATIHELVEHIAVLENKINYLVKYNEDNPQETS